MEFFGNDGKNVYLQWLPLQAIICRREQIPVSHAALLRQHESTRDLEHGQLAKLHRLRVDQMQEQRGVENINQQEYAKQLKKELLARHAAEQKQIPKNVKVSGQVYTRHLTCGRGGGC